MTTELTDSEVYTSAELELIDRAEDDLYAFIQLCWPVLHGGQDIIETWHVPLMCRYLEAIADGRINRLVICIPPGFAKSLTCAVFYPAWRWVSDPDQEITTFSTSNTVVKRDSRRTRNVLKSDIYKRICEHHGTEFEFVGDQNEKQNFELTTGGSRQAYPIGGKNSGKRSDEQIIDDPNDAGDALERPEVVRRRFASVFQKVDGTLADRLNSQNTDPRIIIQQRLYEGDVAGEYIRRGWPHLVLPMEYDPDHPHLSPDDPRDDPGELLCEDIVDAKRCEDYKKKPLYGGKCQQDPSKDAGDLYTDEVFIIDPDPPTPTRTIISVDPTGGGDEGADPSGITVWSDDGQRSVCIDVSNTATRWTTLKSEFERMVNRHGARFAIIESTGLGPSLIEEATSQGMRVVDFSPSAYGGKFARANTATEYWEDGTMRLRSSSGGFGELIDQHTDFPTATHDDLVDSCSQYAIWRYTGAGRKLSGRSKKSKIDRSKISPDLTSSIDLGY